MPEKAQTDVCKRCRTRLPKGARRCPNCGAQLLVAGPADPEKLARIERNRLVREHDLNEIQTQILAAATAGGGQVFVLGKDSLEEGEVKSGEQRFYGDEAVAAVAALAAALLIEQQGEDCFRLTPQGLRVAKALQVPV